MIDKYKKYLKQVYEKIKTSLINPKNLSDKEKFSVVSDVLTFIKKYNEKYNTNIDINLIIQNDDEITNIVNKTCNYILEFFFDIYENEEEKDFELKNDFNETSEEEKNSLEKDTVSNNPSNLINSGAS